MRTARSGGSTTTLLGGASGTMSLSLDPDDGTPAAQATRNLDRRANRKHGQQCRHGDHRRKHLVYELETGADLR
ncbi:hypothetical protein, partial [Paraburkholderia sp. BR14427]|uniref:hypothetical protein n=1 Tax=Paraburkholderia sp. BR14427 TaxID=3237008 RepID=UPI0034CF5BC4